MRIAVSIEGAGDTAVVSPRFGRSAGFVLFDVESGSQPITPAAEMSGIGRGLGSGAGVATAQSLADAGVDAVIAGNFGPNAVSVLRTAGIKMYAAAPLPAVKAVEELLAGRLMAVAGATTPSHSGLRRG